MFVELPGRKGLGKLDSVVDRRCAITVFHSILRIETINLGLDEISRGYLSRQTRVYVRHQNRFRVGRVTDYLKHENGLLDYEVRFPNGNRRDVTELDLFVRPWDAPEDPAEVLAAGGAESQYLHDRRQAAMGPLLALRSAAQGLTSLISAGVDFVPHQIAAVRRVLTDPVQRYLLADEVGLGKTIEAGLIIRQHVIDNPDTQVLIAAPPHIQVQWRAELEDKLHLNQFGEVFECCSHADLVRVSRLPDILVVDEAHHLVGVKEGPLASAAKKLTQLARDTPVLLLLSATPALGDEARFLALLNLLDPVAHPLEDLASFRTKLEKRREMGRMLLGLDPEGPAIVLRQRCAVLEQLFPDDRFIRDLAPRLAAATREAPDKVLELCTILKEHIADSYRIHQRLIRSRRADAKGWEFMPRGPFVDGQPTLSHVRIETDPDQEIEPLVATVEDWRFNAVEAAGGDADLLNCAATRYAELLTATGIGPAGLMAWLDAAPFIFDGEQDIQQSLRTIAERWHNKDRISTMVESTKRLIKALKGDVPHPKIVIFASAEATSSAFREAFEVEDDETDAFLIGSADQKKNAEALLAFREPHQCAILIADRSGEEGLNLSFADAIVHLDLPLSSARIEQRIGRLDRFGRRQALIRHRILLPSDDDTSPWAAWLDFLANGLQIFNRSTSDVQFLLDTIEGEAFRTLLEAGPAGLNSIVASVRARIEDERRSQDEQYALDRIALAEEPVDGFVQALEEAEEDEQTLERGVDNWLIDALQFQKRPVARPEADPFTLKATSNTLVPLSPWFAEFKVDGEQAMTWKRRIATKRSDVIFLRPGTPFVDIAERFTRWDDRGTAFVTWRSTPEWRGDLWIGFRLCFVVEPNLEVSDLLTPTRAELAASRRSQRYFAPRSHVLHVDVNGDAVTDEALLKILERPYRKERDEGQGRDLNLASRPEILADVIDPSSFQQVCRKVRDEIRDRFASEPELRARIAVAERLAQRDIDRRRNRLERRESAGDEMARTDIELIESILPSISQPSIRLDAMGCFIISRHAPRRTSNA